MSADEWVVVRLKVQDRNKFIRDMQASGQSVRAMGKEVEKTGGLFSQGTHHGFLWNQMLFTIRRSLYFATLGLVGLGAAVVATGFKFDAMMETQTLSFKYLTGSAAGAAKEVGFLFDLAASGPFNFAQVIQASRQLMAFGFSVTSANKVLVSLQDAVAGMGLDQASLDRATLALGQIQSSGRLLGQDLRQLEQLGLVNLSDMARRLKVNPAQLASNAGSLGIPSKYAIDAITDYWKEHFKGAAKEFQATFTGQWATIQDFASQAFGSMAKPLFEYTRDQIFPQMQQLTKQINAAFKPGGGGFDAAMASIDNIVGHGLNLEGTFNALQYAIEPMLDIIRLLGEDFMEMVHSLNIGGAALYSFGGLLRGVAQVLEWINPLIKVMMLLWIADRGVLIALNIVTRTKLILDGLMLAMTKRRVFWQGLMTLGGLRESKGLITLIRNWKLYSLAQFGAAKSSRAVIATGFKNNTIMAKTGRIVFGTVIPAMVGYATTMWAAVGSTWAWFTALSAIQTFTVIGAILTLIAALTLLIIKFDTVKDWLYKNTGFFASSGGSRGILGDWFKNHHMGWLSTPIPGIPGMAEGGHTTTAGMAMVGESGPEILSLPRGATVSPLGRSVPAMGGALAALSGGTLEVHSHTYLNSREIAETVTEYTMDRQARA